MAGLRKKKNKNKSTSQGQGRTTSVRSLFKHGIERTRRVFGHRESGSASATTHDAAPVVGGTLDPNKLITIKGGAQHASAYSSTFREWYTDVAIFMDARDATTDPTAKRDLELIVLHHLYKAAVGDVGRARRFGRQITPFLDQNSRYHRSTESNDLINAVTRAYEHALGFTPARPARDAGATASPDKRWEDTTRELSLLHNSSFDAVIQRELNTSDLLPQSRIPDRAAFESAVDELLKQVDTRSATEAVVSPKTTGDRTFFDVSGMFADRVAPQSMEGQAGPAIRDIATELEGAFNDRVTQYLAGRASDEGFNANEFGAKLNKVIVGTQIGAFTEHENQPLLLTPKFYPRLAPDSTPPDAPGYVAPSSAETKHSGFSRTLNTTMMESGYRPDPVQAKEAWLQVESLEDILHDQLLPTVTREGNPAPILPPASPPVTPVETGAEAIAAVAATWNVAPATFRTVNDFRSTQAFQSFKALGTPPPAGQAPHQPFVRLVPQEPARDGEIVISEPDPTISNAAHPPYVTVLAGATAKLLEGLDSDSVSQAFAAKGLGDLLPAILTRMSNAMGQSWLQQKDLPTFVNEIDVIHSHLSAILKIANPHGPTAFNDGLLSYLGQGTIPAGLQSLATANAYPSAIHTVSTALASAAQQKGSTALNVAVLKDSYYESTTAIGRSKTYTTFDVVPSKDPAAPGVSLTPSQGGAALDATSKSPELDVYLAEFQHNISAARASYGVEALSDHVAQLFSEGRVNTPFTVVIDDTIDTLASNSVRDFLTDHADRITSGDLNVVVFKSAQKFDMLGSDNYYGGHAVTINNGEKLEGFNTRMNLPADQLQGLNHQGLSHLVTHAPEGLDAYRAGIMGNTRTIYDALAPGLAGDPTVPTTRPVDFKISALEPDAKQVFLDLKFRGRFAAEARSLLTSGLLDFAAANGLFIDNRPSFGFAIPNLMDIPNVGIRFNPGLDSRADALKFADFFNSVHAIISADRSDPSGNVVLTPREVFKAIEQELKAITPRAALPPVI